MLDHQTPFCNIFVNFFRLVNTFLIRRPSTECAGPRPGPEIGDQFDKPEMRPSTSKPTSKPNPCFFSAMLVCFSII